MTLMKLPPESVRLRRLAKAHAAGEISEAQYRQARRQVVDNFTAAVSAEDDTRPRWSDEPTLRSMARVKGRIGTATQEGEALSDASPRWLWLVAFALVLAAALWTLPEALGATAGVEVPAVSQRDPNPASSPRLSVGEIEVSWAGAIPRPSGLDPAALQTRAEQALAEMVVRNAPGSHGFTSSELEEVARFLTVLGVHQGETRLDAADARDLGALIREQKQRRGVSIAELEEVARAVQSAAREQGYFLAVAYLPAQRVADGVVRIDVLPGRLGDIVVEGGDSAPVAGAFAALLGKPVTLSDVSSRLHALNALPGFTAQASFGPGPDVGETRLHLDVLEQRHWVASVTLDNHGDADTGHQRLGATASWLNPRGVGDRLTAGALVTVNPANQTYGYLEYDMPLGGYRLSTRVGNNDFTQEGLAGLDGQGVFLDVSARHSLSHGRTHGLAAVLAASRHDLDWDDGTRQTVSLAGVALTGHRVWDTARLAADAAVAASLGRIGGDRFFGQAGDFWVLELDAEAWMPVDLPALEGEQKLLVRVEGQLSDSLLPATRRFALGGARRARGFDRGLLLADRGLLLSLEARVPVHLGELVVFADSGYGTALSEQGTSWSRLTDLGIGWDAELLPGLSSRLSWAMPVTADGTGGIDADGSRIYWSLRYDH